ncbi:MAG: phosphorylase [Candidatus Methylumidiphilus sp.]
MVARNHNQIHNRCLKVPEGGWLALADGVLIGLCGAGPVAAERGAQLLAEQGATALLSWGCAAALAPDLRPGALTLPGQILAADGQILDADAAWRGRLLAALDGRLPVQGGVLAESRHIVALAQDKQAIHAATGAIALDMESAAAARAAQALSLPFLAVRSIIDPADTNIPASIAQAFDADGLLHVPQMLGRALLRPLDFIAIIRLGRHFGAAMDTLRHVAALAPPRFAAP